MNTTNEANIEHKRCNHWPAHIGWIVGCLLFIIVCLIAIKWSNYPNFVDRVNFAAALSSLILAVLAIVYAYLQNADLSAAMGKIVGAAMSLQESSKSIGRVDQAATALAENTTKFHQAAVALSENTEKFQATLSKMNEVVAVIPGRIDRLEISIAAQKAAAQSSPATSTTSSSISSGPSDELVRNFLRTSSVYGLQLILTCVLAKKYSRKPSFKELESKTAFGPEDYAHGFFVATVGAQMIRAKIDTDGTITVESIPPIVENEIEKCIAKRLSLFEAETRKTFEEEFKLLRAYMETGVANKK